MNKGMTLFGCGPKLALISLPYVLLSLAVMNYYPDFLDLNWFDNKIAKLAGIIWLVAGFTFWGWSAVFFLKNFKPGILLTTGPFSFCRNPIYSSIIVFIIPGLGLMFHSGLVLSIAIVLYINFRISIHGEAVILRRIFGEKYYEYEKSVNEIFPFPSVWVKL